MTAWRKEKSGKTLSSFAQKTGHSTGFCQGLFPFVMRTEKSSAGLEPIQTSPIIKELQRALEEAVFKLKEADQRKNEFLSILGHELRNPLAAISSGLDIIEQGTEPDEFFPMIRNGVTNMSRLLDELLDLNRVSENRIELKVKTLDLRRPLENVLKAFRPSVKLKGKNLKSILGESSSQTAIRCDWSKSLAIFS